MNSITERWVQTCRRELLDRTLIWNQHHLLHALREFERFSNEHRPHQGLANARPLHARPRMLGPAGGRRGPPARAGAARPGPDGCGEGERHGELHPPRATRHRESRPGTVNQLGRRNARARTLRIVEEALKSGDGTLRLIVFMGTATCAALTLGGGARLAGLLQWC
jgi:hypothetical protein